MSEKTLVVHCARKLAEDFSECPVRQLLAEFGYSGGEPNICIVKLFQKLRFFRDGRQVYPAGETNRIAESKLFHNGYIYDFFT